MPLYETRSESGRMSIRLKAHQLAERDIQDYGPIERSDQELVDRARYHVGHIQLPTPQAILADDGEAFARMIAEYYPTIYKGLLVAYTGLQEPFRLTVEPRYVTCANIDDSEAEHDFTGLAGLQELIRDEQASRRANAKEDGCNPNEYLLTYVQVTIIDTRHHNPDAPRCFIGYDITGDEITGSSEREGVSDDVLYGLGLPFVEAIVSASSGGEE